MLTDIRLLLIDDDLADAAIIERIVKTYSDRSEIVQVRSLAEAIGQIETDRYDIIVSDLNLPDSNGIATVYDLLEMGPNAPIIVVTGNSLDLGRDAIRAGANDYVLKSEIVSHLMRSIAYSIDRYASKQELLIANSMLEERNRSLVAHCEASKQFVDTVSHEFRTPLTVIREYASIIRDGIDGPVNSRQVNRINTLMNRTDDMARMVDDLLDTSRLRLGLVRVVSENIKLENPVNEVVRMLSQRAASKQIAIRVVEFPEDLTVFCDKEKLRRILINLITNSIKFTNVGGEIRIQAQVQDQFIAISVSDTGIGIPETYLNQIFERFQQVSNDFRTTQSKGFGLGLSIANALATMNLGKLEVGSEEGKGSTFTFFVPKAEVKCILKCYFDQRETAANEPQTITAVGIKAIGTSDDSFQLDEIHDMINSKSTCKDLVLRFEERDWTLYIGTDVFSHEEIVQQIRSEYAKLASEDQSVIYPELMIEELGEFQLDQHRSLLEKIGTRHHQKSKTAIMPKLFSHTNVTSTNQPLWLQ